MKKLLSLLLFVLMGSTVAAQQNSDYIHLTQAPPVYRYTMTHEQAMELEEELKPLIAKHMATLNMNAPLVRWTVYVLDVLEYDTPAMIKFWSSGQQWVVIYHFRYDYILALTEIGRSVIIAHEAGHLTTRCMMLTTLELQEVCADIISADLTSPVQVLAMLNYFKKQHVMGDILAKRIEVMENLVKIKTLTEDPTLYKPEEEGGE